jgi:ribosomal protein S24E
VASIDPAGLAEAILILKWAIDILTEKINRLLGHTDLKTSMIYAKANIETLREVVEKLGNSCCTNVTRAVINHNGQ